MSEYTPLIVIAVYVAGVALSFGISMGLDDREEPQPIIAFLWPFVVAIAVTLGPFVLVGWLAQKITEKIRRKL